MSWGLELDLGVKDVSKGHILIDVGGRETAVDLTGNRLSNYTVVVEPQQAPYRILSVSPPHSQAAVFEGRNCDGLRRVGMTAFTAVGRAGHALFHRAEKIDGGRTYAVVWRNDKAAQFPVDWECETLETRGDFSATLVFIPKFLSQASLDWIKANLQLPAVHKIQNIVQVWPPISNRITSQSIQSVRDNAIVVALDEIDVRQATSVFVRCDGDERAAGGIPGARTFFRYEPAGKPTARFLTPNGSGAMLDVEFSLPAATPWLALNAAVVLRLTSNEGISTSAPLHSRYATQALLDIRHGYAKLDYVSMPRAAQGRVRVGLGDAAIEHLICATNKSVAGTKNGFQPSDEDVVLFVDAVCKADADVVVDFGAFGYVSLPAILKALHRKGVTGAAELPEQVRALLKKYLFQFGSTSVWPRPDMRMSDSELIGLFNSSRGMKGNAATRRYLERELARYVDGVTQ
ncbi:hypothetical protein RI103_02415 [Paraburkholderia sp. FT54]|uniref:hypothetical protein n=1 Tax=Paraburkholderia sp. FT54 TaxID=3074437 RepID=UPI002877A7C6|nr:hypothetical protein [Paraburkholderia sp. FT54]WNC90235.1 hypothetical protein RI103_02415 [Paraburkholderia sp. FT54]